MRGARTGSPADAAGLRPGDVILRVGPNAVTDAADLERTLLGRVAGDEVAIEVDRNGTTETIKLQIAALGADRSVPARRTLPLLAGNAAQPPAAADDKLWTVLGVRLTKIGNGDTTLQGQPYRGGMKVTEVRAESPAARNGLHSGDVLVGLHVWETVTPENVTYVLNHPQFSTFNPLKFYILRERETLYGHFDLAATAASHAQ